MNIIINKMWIRNFKGVKSLDIEFNEKITYICGDNGTGKTTIFDGFLWLLFGKDSQCRSDFAIKTLDSEGNEIPYIKHSVKGEFDIDGEKLILCRTLKEKWVRQRGAVSETFMGNETVYEINNLIVKQSEYQRKISEIVDENVFRLITNPLLFCNTKWQEQRKILTEMSGMGSEYTLALSCNRPDIGRLIERGISVEDRLNEIRGYKKKAIKELEAIPIRIDEISRLINLKSRNKNIVISEINGIKNYIADVEKEIKLLKNNDIAREQCEINLKTCESKLERAKAEYEVKANKIKSSNANIRYEREKALNEVNYKIKDCEKLIADSKSIIIQNENVVKALRSEQKSIFDSQFNEYVCPCCGREWESNKLNEKLEKFNKSKSERLNSINTKIELLNDEGVNLKKIIAEKNAEIESLNKSSIGIENSYSEKSLPSLDVMEIISEIERAKAELNNCQIDTSVQEGEVILAKVQLEELEMELNEINGEEKNKIRIDALNDESEKIRGKIVALEKEESSLKDFIDEKIKIVGQAINSKFENVRFKLFENQINGGYSECCQATVKGVPFRDLNAAMKINAGIEIINTLEKYFNISAPIFVDNKESVNKLRECKGQVICLKVTEDREIQVYNK